MERYLLNKTRSSKIKFSLAQCTAKHLQCIDDNLLWHLAPPSGENWQLHKMQYNTK